ncbi:MAG: M48 family metalloprotease [Planctomycetes bacterium]|nr:M48 family metalloprotease [Planctomycetota bacterium]
MYLVVIGVLALILAFSGPPFRYVMEPGWVVAAVAGATVLPAGVAALVCRRTLRLLDRNPADPSIGQYWFGRGMTIVQGVLALLHGGALCTTNWLRLCKHTPLVGDWLVVPGLLATVPFLISILLVWIATYPADRAIREIALETYLFRGRPVRPVWPLPRYLMFNLRHQVLFILVPMLLILAARDVIVHCEPWLQAVSGHQVLPDVLLGIAAVAVAIIAPTILRRVWVTQALPEVPLRDRLVHLCSKLRMRCREILIWHSGGMIVNAAVMGVIAPFRYFLITDAMLEQMEDRRIEAVFGHEAGHVKRHHILFFLLFAFISGCLVTSLGYRSQGMDRTTYQIVIAMMAAALALKWGILFGWISRCFERQADIYALRTLAASGMPCRIACRLHTSEESPNPGAKREEGDPLCQTAAHVFGETLNEVAVLNGIPTEARSWRHGSISSRSRTVIKLAQDPQATARFERRVYLVKVGIFVAALLSGLWAAWDLKLWTLLGIGGG